MRFTFSRRRLRVVLIGHSAGGHLALLAAAELQLPVAALAAGSDLEAWQSEASFAFLAGAPRAEASPRRRLPLGVRQLFVHGVDDDRVPFWLSERWVEAAHAVGDEATLLRLEGAGHFEPIDALCPEWPRVAEAIEALV